MNNEQEDFEAFAVEQGWSIAKHGSDYMWLSTFAAWRAWQRCAAIKDDEIMEQCRLNGMGGQRELALLAKVERLERENHALEITSKTVAL